MTDRDSLTSALEATVQSYRNEPTAPPGFIVDARLSATGSNVYEDPGSGFQAVAFASTDQQEFIIAFTGTQDIQDWNQNIRLGIDQWRRNSAAIATYFAQVAAASPDASVTLVGHSLGGALAQYAAWDIGRRILTDPAFSAAAANTSISVATFNSLGAVDGIRSNPDVFGVDAVSDEIIALIGGSHYFVSGDLVSRLGGGHIGGNTQLFANLRAGFTDDPVRFLSAHSLDRFGELLDAADVVGFDASRYLFDRSPEYLQVQNVQQAAAKIGNLLNDTDASPDESAARLVAGVVGTLTLLSSPATVREQADLDRLIGAVFQNLRDTSPPGSPEALFYDTLSQVPPSQAVALLGSRTPRAAQFAGLVSFAGITQAFLEDLTQTATDFGGLQDSFVNTFIQPQVAAVGWIRNKLAELYPIASEVGDFLAGDAVEGVQRFFGDLLHDESAAFSVDPYLAIDEGAEAELTLHVNDPSPRRTTTLYATVTDPTRLVLSGDGVSPALTDEGRYRITIPQGEATATINIRALVDADVEHALTSIAFGSNLLFDIFREDESTIVDSTTVYVSEEPPVPESGDAIIHGTDMDDDLAGGAGDTLLGGDGNDYLLFARIEDGGRGNDFIEGGADTDDDLRGGSGDDVLSGHAGSDRLAGGPGNDFIAGGAGADSNAGESDLLRGGDGDDLLIGDGIYVHGDHNPRDWSFRVRSQTGVDRSFDLHNIFGGTPADTGDDDLLVGGAGNDLLLGNHGHDALSGGDGADWAAGEAGDDFVSGGTGDDRLFGDVFDDADIAGDDRLGGGDGNDVLIGGPGQDELHGNSGDDVLYGDLLNRDTVGGDDRLYGETGNDWLYGGLGNDLLFAGDGDDRLQGDPGGDVGNGIDYLDAGAGNDIGTGGGGADTIFGGAGDDRLAGDQFSNDPVAASLHGNDRIYAGNGNDIVFGDGGDDLLDGGDGNDRLAGGAGDDELFGGAGADVLDGGPGDDLLSGGAGNDSYLVGSGHDRIVDNSGIDQVLFAGTVADTNTVLDGPDLRLESGGSSLTIANWRSSSIRTAVFAGTELALPMLAGEEIDDASEAVPDFELLPVTTRPPPLPPIDADPLPGATTGRVTHISGNYFNVHSVGRFVSSGSDINGDGIDDLLISGSVGAGVVLEDNPLGPSQHAFVVYGRNGGLPGQLDLNSIDGNNGFVVRGAPAELFIDPLELRALGDINGDGLADIGVNDFRNRAVVLYGGNATQALLSVDAAIAGSGATSIINGGTIESSGGHADPETGEFEPGETNYSGVVLTGLGDISGDGIDDFAADRHVIFGSPSARADIDVAALSGTDGFSIDGDIRIVQAAGDINVDGVSDILVTGSSNAAHLLFGAAEFGSIVDPAVAAAVGGISFSLPGTAISKVNAIGDINGDDVPDLVFEASDLYVWYGNSAGSNINLAELDGSNGFRIIGARNATPAGDVNGDGLGDFAFIADDVHVLFGTTSPAPAVLAATAVDADIGLQIQTATGVTALAGNFDADGDGFADLLVGTPESGSLYTGSHRGAAQVISGIGLNGGITVSGTPGNDSLSLAGERIIFDGGGGDDRITLIGNGTRELRFGGGSSEVVLAGLADGTTTVDIIGDALTVAIDGRLTGRLDITRNSGLEVPVTLGVGIGSLLVLPDDWSLDQLELSPGSLRLWNGAGSGEIHLHGFEADPDAGEIRDFEYFRFADGTTLGYEQLLSRGFDIHGTSADDVLRGTRVTDRLHGHEGNDTLDSGDGNDRLDGGAGNDLLLGGAGDDQYLFNAGDGIDRIVDTGGHDVLELPGGFDQRELRVSRAGNHLNIALADAVSVEIDNWYLDSDARIERIDFAGRAAFFGGDLGLLAAKPVRELSGTASADLLHDTNGDVRIFAGTGNDRIVVSRGENIVYGDAGDDRIRLSRGDDIAYGGAGSDHVLTSAGNDLLDGGAGDDYLIGGSGSDTYRFFAGDGHDQISDSSGDADRIVLGTSASLGELSFSRDGSDFRINAGLPGDEITVLNWYTDARFRAETIESAGGEVLGADDLNRISAALLFGETLRMNAVPGLDYHLQFGDPVHTFGSFT